MSGTQAYDQGQHALWEEGRGAAQALALARLFDKHKY